MTKKKIVVTTIIIFILFGGTTTYFIVQHQTEVHAQELIKQKKEESLKKGKKNLAIAETAVTTAVKTRNDEDIEIAITAIDKLNKKQDSDKTRLTDEMNKLKNWLALKMRLDTTIAKAEKSKSEADINDVQTLLETKVDDNFKEEKKVFQDKLTALEEERKKAQEEKVQQETKTQEETEVSKEQIQQEQDSYYNQASSYSNANENYAQTPTDNGDYQTPTQNNNVQQAPEPNSNTQHSKRQYRIAIYHKSRQMMVLTVIALRMDMSWNPVDGNKTF